MDNIARDGLKFSLALPCKIIRVIVMQLHEVSDPIVRVVVHQETTSSIGGSWPY